MGHITRQFLCLFAVLARSTAATTQLQQYWGKVFSMNPLNLETLIRVARHRNAACTQQRLRRTSAEDLGLLRYRIADTEQSQCLMATGSIHFRDRSKNHRARVTLTTLTVFTWTAAKESDFLIRVMPTSRSSSRFPMANINTRLQEGRNWSRTIYSSQSVSLSCSLHRVIRFLSGRV